MSLIGFFLNCIFTWLINIKNQCIALNIQKNLIIMYVYTYLYLILVVNSFNLKFLF